jgi:hypothetical protein
MPMPSRSTLYVYFVEVLVSHTDGSPSEVVASSRRVCKSKKAAENFGEVEVARLEEKAFQYADYYYRVTAIQYLDN